MNRNDARSLTRSRLKLALVFVMFFGPLLLAVAWYYGLGAAHAPRSGANHAPLITPPVVLESFRNPRLEGGFLELENLRGRWVVIHRVEGACGDACGTSLYNTRQTRLALGRDAGRMHRILLGRLEDDLTEVAREHPDMEIVLYEPGGIESQVTSVARDHGAGPDDAFLLDPLGNVMMWIPVEIDPSDLLKDFKKLMKLSKVG